MVGRLKEATIAACLAAVLILPIFGLKIARTGSISQIEPHYGYVMAAFGIVFIMSLTRPLWEKLFANMPSISMPVLNQTAQQRAIFILFIAGALLPVALVLMRWVWPSFEYHNLMSMLSFALIYVILGLGLNIVVGFAGLLNLGYAGFYAIGGYTFGYLFKIYGFSFWMSLPFAIVMAALIGLALSFLLLRLRGDYLAIVTLAVSLIIVSIFKLDTNLTIGNLRLFGGPDGVLNLPKPTVFGYEILRRAPEGQTTFHNLLGLTYESRHMEINLYLIALALAAITVFVSNRLLRMPLGRAWEALREDEIACRSLGLNPAPIKIWAFTIGAGIAGMAGAFFGARQGLVNPESFQFIESIMILAAVVLGGMGSNLGVIIAAILIVVLQEFGRGLGEYRMLIFGLVLVLMMIWRPQGLLPVKRQPVELPS